MGLDHMGQHKLVKQLKAEKIFKYHKNYFYNKKYLKLLSIKHFGKFKETYNYKSYKPFYLKFHLVLHSKKELLVIMLWNKYY